MTKKIALIEFPIYDQFPILSGYLQGYASMVDVVKQVYQFEYYQEPVNEVDYQVTLRKLVALRADIYCFSSYVWNIRLISRLADDLHDLPFVDRIILGGHQVSDHISMYVKPHQFKTIVVNGPGEQPFRDLLITLESKGDLNQVKGISTYIDQEMYNGGVGEFISDLDSIPSPFLLGYFDHLRYPISIFETNRGCPFQCSFCTWGGPTTKVTKFSIDRLKDELLWMAKHDVFFIFLADANWGMLKRDIELSEYIGQLKRDFGTPWGVFYAASKNTPKRSMECIKAFHQSGVITSQAIGIQSLNDATLEAINRKNIKNEAYFEMFEELKTEGISTYCELIWPLPEENLGTLKKSFQTLLDLQAQTIILYPTILINNAKLTADAFDYKMSTTEALDWKSELRLVKSTNTASEKEVDEGFWFYYSHFLLGNCDGYKSLYGFAENVLGFTAVDFAAVFAKYLQTEQVGSAYFKFLQSIFENDAHGDLHTIGEVATHLLHENRADSLILIAEFIAKEFDKEPLKRAFFIVLWIATFPKIFSNSDSHIVEILNKISIDGVGLISELVDIEEDQNILIYAKKSVEEFNYVLELLEPGSSAVGLSEVEIGDEESDLERMVYTQENHKRSSVYAHGMIQRLGEITPRILIRDVQVI